MPRYRLATSWILTAALSSICAGGSGGSGTVIGGAGRGREVRGGSAAAPPAPADKAAVRLPLVARP